MNRRRFTQLLVGATAWPAATQAQRVFTVGVLVVDSPGSERFWRLFRGFLRELGYEPGRNIRFEFRSDDGDAQRLPALAAELVRLKVDAIVTWFTPAAAAAKRATAEIPIVMASSGDPVGTGLIASLSRPGGNLTGMASGVPIVAKCVQFVRDMLPRAQRLAVMVNAPDPYSKPFLGQTREGADAARFTLATIAIEKSQDVEAAFAGFAQDRPDALVVQPSLALRRIAELALDHRVPSMCSLRGFADAGGLMSYWYDEADMYRRAAALLDKVLKGADPATTPVEQPTRLEFCINLRTARALGLTVPPTLLAQADDTIE